MHILNEWGLHVIEHTQENFQSWAQFFTYYSNTVGNPDSMYFMYFPLIYPFDCQLGIKLVQATMVGDWLNLMMKWVFMGHRPYWWIHEANLAEAINIRQFYNTCETGPGNPSGHVAITGLGWYVITEAIIDKVHRRFKIDIKYAAWTGYTLAMIVLGLSRVYIAAHFPHQCVFGFICAIVSGRLISKLDSNALTLRHYIFGIIFSVVSVLLLQGSLKAIGVDMKWSVKLAHKWCASADWVHVSTTPFYILWRLMGICLGTGLMQSSKIYKNLKNLRLSTTKRTILSIGGLIATTYLVQLAPKKISHPAAYLSVFAFHAVLINLAGTAFPFCLQLINNK